MASGIFLPLHRHPHHLAPSPADLRAVPELCAVFAPFGGAGGFDGALVFKRGGGGGAEVRPAGVALDAALQTSISLASPSARTTAFFWITNHKLRIVPATPAPRRSRSPPRCFPHLSRMNTRSSISFVGKIPHLELPRVFCDELSARFIPRE